MSELCANKQPKQVQKGNCQPNTTLCPLDHLYKMFFVLTECACVCVGVCVFWLAGNMPAAYYPATDGGRVRSSNDYAQKCEQFFMH